MNPKFTIKSTFAILDVMRGRKKLSAHFKNIPGGPCPEELRIPVIIAGYMDGQFGGDDGESIEFTVCVKKVMVL